MTPDSRHIYTSALSHSMSVTDFLTINARIIAVDPLFLPSHLEFIWHAEEHKDTLMYAKYLSTVLDDDAMSVSLVSRGYDLFDAIPVQRILQELLGITPPRYAHHALIPNEHGQRLAKRENALSLRQMRQNGCDREAILRMMTKCRNLS